MFSYINKLRFNYETKLFMQVQLDSVISYAIEFLKTQHDFNIHKRYALGSAVKITPALIPDLYALYQNCLGFAGRGLKGDLYVQQLSEYNAYVYAANTKFNIILSSGIVKDFKAQEIAFVIGHELGHVIFEHNNIPVKSILYQYSGLSYETTHLLFQWSKAAEISADRIGLLCSGNLTSAANVFFKTASGLSLEKDKEEEIIHSLRAQFDEIKTIAKCPSDDLICTHPLIPIRFKSLELISLDILYLRNKGMGAECPGFHAIDSQISDVLMQAEPLDLSRFLSSKEGLSLLILCLLYIAVSDGELNKYEEQFIHDIKTRSGLDINITEVIAVCRQDIKQFKELAIIDISNSNVPKDDVFRIIQLCHYIAIMDNNICNAEIQAMQEICEVLKGEGWYVNSALSQHETLDLNG